MIMPSTSPKRVATSPSPSPSPSPVRGNATNGTERRESRLPSKSLLTKAGEHSLYDAEGNKVPFKSLYEYEGSIDDKPISKKKRTLILFIRHFFCGNCQEYLRHLVRRLPPSSLPPDLQIQIVGCGAHTLIKSYIEQLACSPQPFPYPIYADPTKELYDLLEMRYSLSLGSKSPEYIHRSLLRVNLESTVQGLKRLWAGDALSGGDMRLNGGEFLVEVGEADGEAEVKWCHRMTNSRDHAEIETLKNVLQLDNENNGDGAVERPSIGRRRSTADRLRHGFSERRQSWLRRSGSLDRRRESRDSSREVSRRRSPGSNLCMNVMREEVKSRDGEEKPAFAGMNGSCEKREVLT